jgi:hypothetical protein
MRCDTCKNWTTARVTRYGDGSEVVNWRAPEGKGRCSELGLDTPEAFGCTSFAPLITNGASIPTTTIPHIISNWKNGSPWQHWTMGPCPDCRGHPGDHGKGLCRCAGTGKVRYYDDGYIGEEQTRLHPREREHAEPLRCRNCKETVEVRWMACPMCGQRLEGVAETEHVDGLGNAGGDFKDTGKSERAANLKEDIDKMNERSAKIATMRSMTVERGCTEAEAATAAAMADKLEAMR